ncbi:MAG: hypothetical protein ACXWC9_08375 [Pseudobdellovibrionaceae bacterium]
MKASINVLDGQREMVQVNYPYLAAIGMTMKDNLAAIINVIDISQEGHLDSLLAIRADVAEFEILARNENIKAVLVANNIRQKCIACHATQQPQSGVQWEDVFHYDWEKVAMDCNRNGANPFICRNMNGLLTAYSHILKQMITGLSDFEVLRQNALEIVRLFSEMKKANALHMSPELTEKAAQEAQEIAILAENKDSRVEERATNLAQTCTSCHAGFGQRESPFRSLPLWR